MPDGRTVCCQRENRIIRNVAELGRMTHPGEGSGWAFPVEFENRPISH